MQREQENQQEGENDECSSFLDQQQINKSTRNISEPEIVDLLQRDISFNTEAVGENTVKGDSYYKEDNHIILDQ